MQVSKNKVVAMEYTLTDNKGETLDSSVGADPLLYIQGTGQIVLGLEQAMEGKSIGDVFKVAVSPELGYGIREAKLEQKVPREEFEGVDNLEVGMEFQAETDAGVRLITIIAIEGDMITIDGNHPLAGQTLNFDIKVISIREATKEELSHGHAHGEGGHHH